MPTREPIIRTTAYPVPIPPPPPPHPAPPQKEQPHDFVTAETPLVPRHDIQPYFPPRPPNDTGLQPSAGTGTVGPINFPPPPPPEPVRTGPSIDPRSLLQPPYPPALEREGVEGEVTVRVLIGPDGRVRSVEKMSATRDDFFLATERHALRNWRFRPATIDGRPVESSKVMLLRFQLNG
jgi:protein TonB